MKIFSAILFLIITIPGLAQTVTGKAGYESLDTAQIRKVLSEPFSFSEENIDTLATKFQLLYARSNSLGFWWGRMKSSSLLGFAYEMNGNNELSLMCFSRAMSIANERKEFNPFLTDIYIMLADEYESRGQYEKIPELLDKCEGYVNFYKGKYSRADFASELLDIYCLRSKAYVGMNQISKAENALSIAIRSLAEVGRIEPPKQMKINLTRYSLDFHLRRYKTCEKLIFENIDITRKLDGHNRGRFTYALNLAKIYVGMGDYNKAYSYADSAKQAKLYDKYLPWQLNLQREMIKVDSATGNVQKLIARYKKIQALNDTINARNRHSSVAYYQTELDIQTQINSLKQKEEESRNKSIIIERAVIIATAALVIVLLLSVILFIIWKNNRKNQRHVSELSRLNEEIESRHADAMVAFASLEKSHDENQQLIKVVAHDLRNPLYGSMLYLNLMESMPGMNKDLLEAVDNIKISTVNSLELIDTLLHDNKQLKETEFEMADLKLLLQYCVNLFEEKARDKNQKIELEAEPVHLLLDREKIWRVMNNLIHNAVKFSPSGGNILVRIQRKADCVLTIIKDDGIGIPDSLQNHIFDFFAISQRPGTNGEESFGMGLAVSKSIIEAHNGAIWFESKEGLGTTFFVELPMDPGNVKQTG